jgi:cytochrome c-type biogenesis protein CcmH
MRNFLQPKLSNGFALFLWLWSCNLNAAIDVYQFKNDAETERFQQLTSDLRCPNCQNQNIADSNAEIARDLRQKIFDMLSAGQTNDEIIDYMVARYGDFVLYEPRINKQTYLLWYGPVVLLFIGILITIWIARRSLTPSSEENDHLDKDQQKQLQELLKENKKS